MSRIDSAINIDDLKRMAKRRLPKIMFDFIEGGADDEGADLVVGKGRVEPLPLPGVQHALADERDVEGLRLLAGHLTAAPLLPGGHQRFCCRPDQAATGQPALSNEVTLKADLTLVAEEA